MIAKTENGWGSVHNGGITGGSGGEEYTFTDFVAMWLWMKDNLTTPAILTYTGTDFSRAGFPTDSPDSTFSNTSRYEIQGLKNKTIRASQGQTLTFCAIRFRTNENIIWENWSHFDSLDDLTACINDTINVWIRHCTINGNSFDSISGTADGSCDITVRCNYIAVTDCHFINSHKNGLIGERTKPPEEGLGFFKVTYRRNKFTNCIERKPACDWGQIGLEYNIVNDSGLVNTFGSSKVVQVSIESQIFSYRNSYQEGRELFQDRFGIDAEITTDNWGALKSVEDVIGTWLTNKTVSIRPELVEWDPRNEPNYTLETWTAAEAETYVDQWAGATMHLMGETPTTYILTLTTTSGGTATRDPASGDIAQNATVILTATPATGFNFSRWQNVLTGQVLSQNETYNHVMTADISIVAVFVSDVPVDPSDVIRFVSITNPVV